MYKFYLHQPNCISDFKFEGNNYIKMEVSSGSAGHLGHSHGGTSNIGMNLNSTGAGINSPNEGKFYLFLFNLIRS